MVPEETHDKIRGKRSYSTTKHNILNYMSSGWIVHIKRINNNDNLSRDAHEWRVFAVAVSSDIICVFP